MAVCLHCGDSGIIHVITSVTFDFAGEPIYKHDYDKPCLACPAGQVWTEAMLGVTYGEDESIGRDATGAA